MSTMLVMKALNTGLTVEGLQWLSLGILGSPSTYEVQGSTVTVTPTMAYSALRAMVFTSLAQKLAPAGISVFVGSKPVLTSDYTYATTFPCYAYLDFTGLQRYEKAPQHCFATGVKGGDIIGTLTTDEVPLTSLLFYVDAPSNMYDLLQNENPNVSYTLQSASTGLYLAGNSTKGFYWSDTNTGDAVFTALSTVQGGASKKNLGVTSNFLYPINSENVPTGKTVTWCNPSDAQANVQFVVPKQN
jgi:hypothetical protein